MPNPLLTEAQVLRIRELWDERNIDVRKEADYFDVSPETIRRIGRRDTYRHVGVPVQQAEDHRTLGKSKSLPSSSEIESLLRLKNLLASE